jgi:TonB-linked SusC/RagA family outer membrane protein
MLFLTSIVNAQTAGSTITGRVYDDQGPISMCNIVEIDDANRIVTHTVADVNGNFSFQLKSPKNRIKIAYVGYKEQILPINKTHFNVRLVDNTTFSDVVITAAAKTEGNGLSIPQREVGGATQKIDAAEFEGLGISTIDEALQGRVAGLDIVYNSGNLGAGTSMRLRGASSISGSSEPLIVVNGTVLVSSETSTFDYSNADQEQFAQLLNVNPEDIQSITVSKDGASTAVWGSQGSNGVIEIKTKRGIKGKTRVQYSYRLTTSKQPDGMKMLNGDQYTMLLKESYFNPSLNDAASNISELNYDPSFSEYQMYNNNTDWIEAVKQRGFKHDHTLTISGGGDKALFRISAGYSSEKGSIIAQQLDRYTTRVSLDYFVSDRIKFTTDFDMTYTDNDKNYSGLLAIAYKKMPNLAIYEEDANGRSTGDYYQIQSSNTLSDQKDLVNPIALAYEAVNNQKTLNLTPVFELKYNLLGLNSNESQLTYNGRIQFSVFNEYDYTFYPGSLETNSWNSDQNDKVSNYSLKNQGLSTRHNLTFIPRFENKDHSLSTFIQAELNTNSSSSQSNSIYGVAIPSTTAFGLFGSKDAFSTGFSEGRSLYFTTQTHYSYKSKYSATFSARLDGTTKLGPSKRWMFQPAISGRWNISDEEFMKKYSSWLSMWSLRSSLSLSGNQPSSEYLFFSRYGSGTSYNGESSMKPNNIRLSNLKMEKVVKWNVGSDFGFFNDRITVESNVYASYKSDMYQTDRQIPTSTGYSTLPNQNNGSMTNKGWDLNIVANRFIRRGKFSADFNLSFNNNSNELTSLDATILKSYNGEFNNSNGSYLSRVQLHNPVGSIYGFRYKGVYQYSDYSDVEDPGVSGPNAPVVRNANGEVVYMDNGKPKPLYFGYGKANYEFKGGDAIYEDVNHDGNINELDIVYLGSSLPKVMGGFGFTFRYAQLKLSTQFVFRLKQMVVNQARMNAENMYSNNNQCLSVNWRWRVEGDITTIPRALYNYGYNYLGSDRFVEDASFLRMNSMTLGYDVDAKLIRPIGLSGLSLTLSLSNLFVLTKYSGNDPEVTFGTYSVSKDESTTPRSSTLTAGIVAKF